MRELDEVGKELGLSRECVRQIEKKALEKLSVALKAKSPGPTGCYWHRHFRRGMMRPTRIPVYLSQDGNY
ncbi:sigma factor-like helix-turn-helix DNA-binding protein [Candidatus Marimicrobium litorale]|uniref:RNA polymerase sigma-70 region 4 domain-containing protein n=1 Tax=Candidatus Marimicrobium litorale TaxID=2518991 RepID=A0ABT3T5M6_9GAMM|nr:hypothetical protein [Candidatus Marimicrobium litorale]